jgi:hypothetical protein
MFKFLFILVIIIYRYYYCLKFISNLNYFVVAIYYDYLFLLPIFLFFHKLGKKKAIFFIIIHIILLFYYFILSNFFFKNINKMNNFIANIYIYIYLFFIMFKLFI